MGPRIFFSPALSEFPSSYQQFPALVSNPGETRLLIREVAVILMCDRCNVGHCFFVTVGKAGKQQKVLDSATALYPTQKILNNPVKMNFALNRTFSRSYRSR